MFQFFFMFFQHENLNIIFKRKFPKLRTLTSNKKPTIFLGEYIFPKRFFQFVLTPEPFPTRKHAKIKKYFLQNAIFHFLLFFPPFFNSTQSGFGCYKNEFKHCTPPIMVWLASSTPTVSINSDT